MTTNNTSFAFITKILTQTIAVAEQIDDFKALMRQATAPGSGVMSLEDLEQALVLIPAQCSARPLVEDLIRERRAARNPITAP